MALTGNHLPGDPDHHLDHNDIDALVVTTLPNAIAGKVSLTGAETIAGVKTFSDKPVVPDASFSLSKLITTGTADATTFLRGDGTWSVVATGAPSNMVTTDSVQTLTAAKSFTPSANADATTTTRNSPSLTFTTRRWTGSASADESVVITAMRGDASPGSYWLNVSGGIYSLSYVDAVGGIYDNGSRVYSANNPPPGSGDTPVNMMTTDGAQNVSGVKTFTATPVFPDGTVTIGNISATGTASGTTFLAGDGAWKTALTAAPSNMVTTDTSQTITGAKTVSSTLTMDSVGTANAGTPKTDSRRVSFTVTTWNGGLGYSSAQIYGSYDDAIGGPFVTTAGAFKSGGQLYEGANRVYSSANPPSAPANMVTTDTTQSIPSSKYFQAAQNIESNGVATMVQTMKDSYALNFTTSYYNGAMMVMEDASLYAARNSTAAGDLRLHTAAGFRANGGIFDGANRVYSLSNKVPVAGISATGTADSTTYLRGDGTWAAASGGGGVATQTSGLDLNVSALASPPSNPTVGDLWVVSDATAVATTYAVEPFAFSATGTIAVTPGTHRIYLEHAYVIESIRASVGTAPVGASIIVDVNLNGTSIYGTQANRPTIIAGANTALGGAPTSTSVASGQYLTVDIDQVGSTTAGANLTVVIRLRRA